MPRNQRLETINRILDDLTEEQALILKYEWRLLWARENQIIPDGEWDTWLLLAGRGFGKTRAGSEAVNEVAEKGIGPIALVAPTAADVRDVMVEGTSGIIATAKPWFMPQYEPSKRRLTWPNGVTATTFSAEEPDRLRGPQFAFAWGDELAAWEHMQETYDMLQFCLRLGDYPKQVYTTTPRPLKVVREMLQREGRGVVVSRGSTLDNAGNLAPSYIAEVKRRYEGTRLGRQELYGEVLDDIPGALWTIENISENRRSRVSDDLQRICVALDPPVTSGENADECGIVVAGRTTQDGHCFILEDGTSHQETPEQWARRAVRLYHKWNADCIVAEVNNGGDMIESMIRQSDRNVPVVTVRATRGKVLRAEPVAALYEQNRVHHVGDAKDFAKLEDQMRQITTDFDKDKAGFSPDRVDALVWAVTHLMLGEVDLVPGIREI